jgi:TolA-binding protein
MRGYTFRMKGVFWLLLLGSAAAAAWGWWRMRRRMEDQQREEAVRAATFAAQAMPGKRPAASSEPATTAAPEEQLLFDAAFKAGQAGEPALAIQLYARLISRFPKGVLAVQARAGVEAQKKKLAIPKAPGPAAPG